MEFLSFSWFLMIIASIIMGFAVHWSLRLFENPRLTRFSLNVPVGMSVVAAISILFNQDYWTVAFSTLGAFVGWFAFRRLYFVGYRIYLPKRPSLFEKIALMMLGMVFHLGFCISLGLTGVPEAEIHTMLTPIYLISLLFLVYFSLNLGYFLFGAMVQSAALLVLSHYWESNFSPIGYGVLGIALALVACLLISINMKKKTR